MAALFDPNNPGEDDPYLSNVSEAYNQGYGYNDITDHHMSEGILPPPKPSLDDAMSGQQISPEMFGPASIVGKEDTKRSDQDAIEAGAGPVGEFAIGAAAGGIPGLAKSAAQAIPSMMADVSGELAPGAMNSLTGWLHGANTPLTEDMMQAGRSMWLTQNPGVAKNVGNILHDVELRPGAALDVTEDLAGKSVLQQQAHIYDTVQKLQLDNPNNYRYVDAYIKDSGPVRVALNQRQAVLRMQRRR